jgi:hypothetical protein
MRVGDILEWAALGCLVAASYLYLGAPLALLAAGLGGTYFAQCYSGHAVALPKLKLRLPRLRLRRRPET